MLAAFIQIQSYRCLLSLLRQKHGPSFQESYGLDISQTAQRFELSRMSGELMAVLRSSHQLGLALWCPDHEDTGLQPSARQNGGNKLTKPKDKEVRVAPRKNTGRPAFRVQEGHGHGTSHPGPLSRPRIREKLNT